MVSVKFDSSCGIGKRSGAYISRSFVADMKKIVKELINQHALRYTHGRAYKHFTGVKYSLLASIDITTMFKWTEEHKRKVHLKKCARNNIILLYYNVI